MINGGIEDIQIGASYKSTKKKGKKGLIFFLLLVVIIGAGIYYYFNSTNKIVDNKSAFFKHLSNSNIKSIIDEDIYSSLKKRVQTENSEIQSSVNFSTSMESEILQDIDISKFTLDINSKNDIENSKSFSEIGINYSGNKVLGINLLSDNDKLAIVSDEIVNKYIGFHYDKIKDVLGKDYNLETLYKMKDSEYLELSSDEKQEILEKYYKLILNQIPEDKFSMQENIVISKDSENINVSAYTLNLSQEELNEILISILTEIRNDNELLEKFITNKENKNDKVVLDLQSNVDLTPVQESEEITETTNLEENIEEVVEENNSNEEINENEENNQDEVNINAEIVENSNEEVVDENNNNEEILNENNSEEIIDEEIANEEDELEESFESLLLRIILGKKINTTLENAQNKIDEIIEEIKNYDGNGIKITVYASEEKTEKISIILPSENTLEFEILNQTDSENNIDITYLYKGENSFFEKASEKFEKYFTEENENLEEQEQNPDQINGFKINIDKIQNSANTTLKIVYNFIENEKINKKISLNLKTDGISTSKIFSNDIVLTFSTNDGKSTKVVIDNTINFKNAVEIESLTDENCFFLETLSEEEYNNLIEAIKDRIKVVYEEKKERFNFIDTNLRFFSY
jgi:hypothetical protein